MEHISVFLERQIEALRLKQKQLNAEQKVLTKLLTQSKLNNNELQKKKEKQTTENEEKRIKTTF